MVDISEIWRTDEDGQLAEGNFLFDFFVQGYNFTSN